MALNDISLTELVAELQERLRRFSPSSPVAAAAPPGPGPLDAVGRSALAARLVAAALAGVDDPDCAGAATAFGDLAVALQAVPTPLAGSDGDKDLRQLVRALEDLALAWDAGADADPRPAWSAVREAGDLLWRERPRDDAAPANAEADRPVAVWLLVAGCVRRETLGRRLEAAGLDVECLADAEVVVARLEDERPRAVICDDAAPARHRSRLSRLLPASALPVIEVRGRADRSAPGRSLWLPPYRAADLLARLGG